MKISEVKVILEQTYAEVFAQVKAERDRFPKGTDERKQLNRIMNGLNGNRISPEDAAAKLARFLDPSTGTDDDSRAGQQPNSEPAIDTPQSATEVWDQIKAYRDTLPDGDERVRLSNLMNQINKSTTSPERAADILADAGLGGQSPDARDAENTRAADRSAADALARRANTSEPATPPGDSAADVAQDDAARTAAQPTTPTEPTATRPQPTRPGQQTSGANFGAITSNLRRGSRGEGVRALQQRLGINADGIFGPQTDQAVRSFQQQNNLQVDGIVGTQTLAALQGQSPAPAPGRITAAPATSVRPQARPAQTGTPQTASKQNTGNALIEGIIKLAGVKKKSLNEASISINGADANEVAEIVRLMQLAGAGGAKPVDTAMINQPDSHMGSCGCSSCAAKQRPTEPDMGDMIRMISSEEEDLDGDFQGSTTAPDEEYSDFSASIPSGNDLHREKGAYPATAGGDNPMRIKEQLMKALAEKKAKPDFLDIDGDGDTKEPMKKAAQDAKKGSAKDTDNKTKGLSDKQKKLPAGLQKAIAKKKTNEGAPAISPKFIKNLQVIFGDKEMLSRSEERKVEDMLNKLSIENIKTLVGADIPHISDKAKEYMRDNTPGGMKNYGEDMALESTTREAEVQTPSHELSDTARKATAMAQKIKRKINSGEEMDDLDYNQMAELGTTLSRVGTSFGPKNMKDVLKHMQEYTDDRNQEGNKYPEFTVDRFKELVAMASR